jgi:hypothetical protein
MASAVIKLAVPTEPTTALTALLADRAGLAAEAKRLAGVLARLQTEAAAGDALNAELDRLAETETNEMKAWAAGGCVGPAPKGKQAERQAIAIKMATTNATAAAARAAIADTDAKIAELNNRFRAISAQIDHAVFDTMETEHSQIIHQYAAACEHGAQLAAKIHGLANYYGETGRRLISQGDSDAGAVYLQRGQALTGAKLPSPGVSRHEIEAAASGWSRRAATLRNGQ